MSNLLEKAIVDAKALKEAALKNAEQLVIEKYSDEVKEAVGRLLEQDEMGFDAGTGMDDTTMDTGLDMGDDLGMEDIPGEEIPEEPSAEAEGEPLDPETIVGGLPDAFDSDDEIVSIKLDSLDADYIEDDEVGVFGGDDEYADDEIGIDILDDIEDEVPNFDGEEEINLEEPGEDTTGASIDITDDIMQEVLSELGIDETEIDLEDLMEKVRVDFEPVKSGWAGTPESIMQEYESMLLAREQDSEVKEENEELR